MRFKDIEIEVRLALLDLGRDPHVKLPRTRADLDAMRVSLRIEQAMSQTSKLRPEIKAARLACLPVTRTDFPHEGYDNAATFSVVASILAPIGFVNSTYRNDTCPSLYNEASNLHLFVDYLDPEKREYGGEMFTLIDTDAEIVIAASDNFTDIMKEIQ